MSDPYLILHKVRGEPAFDIAIKIMIGEEQGWIIPTSGHRAYPYQHWPLDKQWHVAIPDDWPDHYDAKRDAENVVDAARNALVKRGRISAAKPTKPAYRRC